MGGAAWQRGSGAAGQRGSGAAGQREANLTRVRTQAPDLTCTDSESERQRPQINRPVWSRRASSSPHSLDVK